MDVWRTNVVQSSSATSVSEHDRSYTSDGDSAVSVGSSDSCSSSVHNKCHVTDRHNAEQRRVMKAVHLNNEAIRLQDVLDRMTPEEVKNVLLNNLHGADSKALVALGILFPRSDFPLSREQHCVRCHVTFDDQSRTPCLLRHPANAVSKQRQDPTGSVFRCRACTSEFKLSNAHYYSEGRHGDLAGPCYRGHHTTNPALVSYGLAARRCEENGCIEYFV